MKNRSEMRSNRYRAAANEIDYRITVDKLVILDSELL